MVLKMRESEYGYFEKYGNIIPADWRPRSHLEYMWMVSDPFEYCHDPEQRPLHTALRVDDSKSLIQIWNETPEDVRVQVLGDVDKMGKIAKAKEPWKRDQFNGFVQTIW